MQNRSAEQRLVLARRKQNEMLADGVYHLLSRLANGARHLPSSLANGACHLPPRAALSACDLPSCSASSACHFPSRPAGGACRLARSSLCRRHSCSPLLSDVAICPTR